MAKKHKKIEMKRLPTKHQLSKWERQKKIQRYILIIGVIFFVLILAFIGYGYYDAQVKPFNTKAMRINDTVVDMSYYLGWLNIFLRGTQVDQAPMMAEMVLSTIVQSHLLLQRAPPLGVIVTDSEVESELAKLNLPLDNVRKDTYRAQLLHDRLMSSYFDSKVPVVAKQVKAQAMFLETEKVVEQIINMLNKGEDFSKLAKEFSVEDFIKEKSGEIGWLLEGQPSLVGGGKFSDSLLNNVAFSTASGMLSKPTYDSSVLKKGGYWILEVTERDKEQSNHVRGILVGSDNDAMEVRRRLNNGEDFATVAKEISQHLESKDFGGDLGWVQKGYGNEVVVKAAFDLSIGVPSEPLRDETAKTKGGYWLVRVLEKDDKRQVDEDTREQLKGKVFQDWMEEQINTSTIEQYLDEKQKAWAVDYTLKKLGVSKK